MTEGFHCLSDWGCECGGHAMHVEIRGQAQVLACVSHFLETGLLLKQASSSQTFWGVPVSASHLSAALGDRCTHVWLYVASGYPNSGSHTWETGTLPTEPFAQSCELFSVLTDLLQLLCAEILSWAL